MTCYIAFYTFWDVSPWHCVIL